MSNQCTICECKKNVNHLLSIKLDGKKESSSPICNTCSLKFSTSNMTLKNVVSIVSSIYGKRGAEVKRSTMTPEQISNQSRENILKRWDKVKK